MGCSPAREASARLHALPPQVRVPGQSREGVHHHREEQGEEEGPRTTPTTAQDQCQHQAEEHPDHQILAQVSVWINGRLGPETVKGPGV